ncbi:hypothetical protein ACIRRI_06790 [Streptomyces mirabilis]|uniref:hypothetical protein n=1 Tax=Streptomyces mirabilis TaxID=68239 RepID=UPI00381DB1BA
MTREERLSLASTAMDKATQLARDAEFHARSSESRQRAQPLAAAGALWADIARAHTDIARLLPETESADA